MRGIIQALSGEDLAEKTISPPKDIVEEKQKEPAIELSKTRKELREGDVVEVQFVSKKNGMMQKNCSVIKKITFDEGTVRYSVYMVDDGMHVGLAVNKQEAIEMEQGAVVESHPLNNFEVDYVAVEYHQYRGGKNNLPKQFIMEKLWKRFARIKRAKA